nr:hypothetical protein CFP56_38142 [Quercus suber]
MSNDEGQEKIQNNELDGYGQWMVVTRKKKAQKPRLAGLGEGSTTSGGELEARGRRDSKRKASVYADNPKIGAADKTSTSIPERQSAKGRESNRGRKSFGPGLNTVGAGGKKAGLRFFKFGYSSGLGAESKEGQAGPITPNKEIGAPGDTPVFRFGSSSTCQDHGTNTREVGDILQRENHSNRRHNDHHDQEGSYGNHGVVRMGVDASLEEHFPSDRAESQDRIPPRHGRSMEPDSKSMVEVPNGQTDPSFQHIDSVRASLKSLPLGTISDRARNSGRRAGVIGEESSQQYSGGVCGDGTCSQGEAHPTHNASGEGYRACENQPGRDGDLESCCDGFSRGGPIEAGVDGEMEVEGARESLRC